MHTWVGALVGKLEVGATDGVADGEAVGPAEGVFDGASLGAVVGVADGPFVGYEVTGAGEGMAVGSELVGEPVGATNPEQSMPHSARVTNSSVDASTTCQMGIWSNPSS